tara:strand:+ start:479 stop:805 length:327 start_codon:yes stop_codon:yes gene_type:complete
MKYKLYLIGALLLFATNANAGLFGAGLKPDPNITLFGQKLSWPIPSLCIGAKAGVLPDAGVSSEGINFKIPYFSVDLPFPTVTIKGTNSVTKVKIGAVEKTVTKEVEK